MFDLAGNVQRYIEKDVLFCTIINTLSFSTKVFVIV